MERWLLPEGVEESLPPEAWRLEGERRRLLDLYRSWGYELIRPPLIEYLDSLLTGAGHDLELATFKLTDQLSGRMMGVRSDMTTQAARIDAHRIGREDATRYCYIGSVLRTRPDGMGGSRTPLQVGAELFGSSSVQADLEILQLMLATLDAMGLQNISLDLGHVGIYRALEEEASLDVDASAELFDILQRKSLPDLKLFAAGSGVQARLIDNFAALIELNGDLEVLDTAARRLEGAGKRVQRALADLSAIAQRLRERFPALPIHVDLAELRGYRYKTGVVFAAFVPGRGREVARGGRYDGIGASFGRARPATGFSADLNELADLVPATGGKAEALILAPAGGDAGLVKAVADLRAKGSRVLWALDEGDLHEEARRLNCTAILVQRGSGWEMEALSNA